MICSVKSERLAMMTSLAASTSSGAPATNAEPTLAASLDQLAPWLPVELPIRVYYPVAGSLLRPRERISGVRYGLTARRRAGVSPYP